jgi:hypothetical protein
MVDTNTLRVIERLPGWRGRYFNSDNMTFAHYEFDKGAAIHEHFHPQARCHPERSEGSLGGTRTRTTSTYSPT